jgi:hypothetical protein
MVFGLDWPPNVTIKSRQRTGKGVWYAVIETDRYRPGEDFGRVDEIAFEKCNGRDSAIMAARRWLKENADAVSEHTSLRSALYSELEWTPEKGRR